MRAFIAWLFALVPIAWIGWLLWHFAGVGGNSMAGIAGIGLGPTVLGLSIIGLLFLIGPLVKLLRVASGANKVPGASLKIGDDVPNTEGFDADAAFAHYMSQRGADAETPAADAPSNDPVRPRSGGFGRKIA